MEALCNNLAVSGQRVYNFLDYTGVGHDFSDAFLFAVLGRCFGRQDECLTHFGKLLFESVCDGLKALLQRTVQPVEQLEIFKVVLKKERANATLLAIEELCLVLDQDLLLEDLEELLVEVGPTETFLKARLL